MKKIFRFLTRLDVVILNDFWAFMFSLLTLVYSIYRIGTNNLVLFSLNIVGLFTGIWPTWFALVMCLAVIYTCFDLSFWVEPYTYVPLLGWLSKKRLKAFDALYGTDLTTELTKKDMTP